MVVALALLALVVLLVELQVVALVLLLTAVVLVVALVGLGLVVALALLALVALLVALLVELQVLLDDSHHGQPRRLAVGMDSNRLALLLAVLHRHGGIFLGDQDVFVNVVGGVRVEETSADLALLLALVSSMRNRALPTLGHIQCICKYLSVPWSVPRGRRGV